MGGCAPGGRDVAEDPRPAWPPSVWVDAALGCAGWKPKARAMPVTVPKWVEALPPGAPAVVGGRGRCPGAGPNALPQGTALGLSGGRVAIQSRAPRVNPHHGGSATT